MSSILQQAKNALRSRIKNIFKTTRIDCSQPEKLKVATPKLYQKPALKKLTLEQTKLLLIGHSSIGTDGANDLLGLIFPDPGYTRPDQTRLEKLSA